MKKISEKGIAGMVCMLFTMLSFGQQVQTVIEAKNIEPFKIAVSYNKTSNLIFPNAIKSVDRGSADILVQKAKAIENILQVKAAQMGFSTTNLSVVTADGKFYSFIVDYAIEPLPMNLNLSKDTMIAFPSEGFLDEAALTSIAEQIKFLPSFLHKKVKEQKMKLSLQSIYLSDNAMWFKLGLDNESFINYKPDYIRFFIRDRKRSKRTAVQENKLKPIFQQIPLTVNGNEEVEFVYGFSPFTIPTYQELILQVTERNGGRSLKLRISHKTLLKARLLE